MFKHSLCVDNYNIAAGLYSGIAAGLANQGRGWQWHRKSIVQGAVARVISTDGERLLPKRQHGTSHRR